MPRFRKRKYTIYSRVFEVEKLLGAFTIRHDQTLSKKIETSFPRLSGVTVQALEKAIYGAFVKHFAGKIMMGDTRITREQQRQDIDKLLGSLDETINRLTNLNLPPLLEIPARESYEPCTTKIGKASLDEEITELCRRLSHLLKLFESIKLPTMQTNPGRKERDGFLKEIEKIYKGKVCQFYPGLKRKEEFIVFVFCQFHIPLPEHLNKTLQRLSDPALPSAIDADAITVRWDTGEPFTHLPAPEDI